MNQQKHKNLKRAIRHTRVRSRISGEETRPRLAVFKANRHIYAQLIDDEAGKTLVQASSLEVKTKGKKSELATEVGKNIATKAIATGIKSVKFDSGGLSYHGRRTALAEGARAGGLEF